MFHGIKSFSQFLKGQGANQALLDAISLARKLSDVVRGSNSKPEEVIPAALAEFEEEMLRRSALKVAKSADAASFLHSDVAISEGNGTRGAAAVDSNANELKRRGEKLVEERGARDQKDRHMAHGAHDAHCFGLSFPFTGRFRGKISLERPSLISQINDRIYFLFF